MVMRIYPIFLSLLLLATFARCDVASDDGSAVSDDSEFASIDSLFDRDIDSDSEFASVDALFNRDDDDDDSETDSSDSSSDDERVEKVINKITKAKSLSTKSKIYQRNGLLGKFDDSLLRLKKERKLKFFRSKEARRSKAFLRKVLRYLRKQAKKQNQVSIDPNDPANTMIIKINEARNLSRNFWEGDIVVPDTIFDTPADKTADEILFNTNHTVEFSRSTKRNTSPTQVGIGQYLWSNGKIPYVFDQDYPSSARAQVENIMTKIKQQTCIKFVPRTNQHDYVYILSGLGCSSPVGKHSAVHIISLDAGSCTANDGIIYHELGHIIGLHHTQSRLDRNEYVNVNHANVQPGFEHNFAIYPNIHSDDYNVEYDYKSVMHYGENDFGKNGAVVLTPRVTATIGQRSAMSYFDYVTINQMYECYSETPYYWPMDQIDTEDKVVIGSYETTPAAPSNPSSNFRVGLDAGKTINSLRIRGNDAYANMGSFPGECLVDPEKCNNGFTVSFWFRIAQSSENKIMHLLSSYEWQSLVPKDRGYDITYDGIASYVHFIFVQVQKKWVCKLSQVIVSHSGWNHLAISYDDNDDVDIYLDGVKKNYFGTHDCPLRSNFGKVHDINPTLVTGKLPNLASESADFWIDEIAFFKKPLDSSSVSKVMSDGPYFDKSADDGSLGRKEAVNLPLQNYMQINV